jgi:hypothetical protein
MAQKTIYFCDCCRKEIDAWSTPVKVTITWALGKERSFDLCSNCADMVDNDIRFENIGKPRQK